MTPPRTRRPRGVGALECRAGGRARARVCKGWARIGAGCGGAWAGAWAAERGLACTRDWHAAYGEPMALRWYTTVIDAHDIATLSRWWAQTLDWQIVYEDDEEVAIIPKWVAEDRIGDLAEWLRSGPGMVFVPVPEGKTVKNRLHIDLAPHKSQDRDAEVAALLERGATHADVGQSDDVTWTVLADPEGNEFCVLSARDR